MMKAVVVFAVLLVWGANAEEAFQGNFLPRPRFENKVIGGSPINITSWNSIVSLQRGISVFGHTCGGNILTVSVLISAAHCFEPSQGIDWDQPQYWRVRAGSNYHASGGIYLQLSRVVRHASYDDRTVDYDIAVLRLSTQLTLSPTIGQAIIPPQDATIADNSPARTAGWGATVEGGGSVSTLNAADLQIINQTTCYYAYILFGGVTPRMICAGWPTGGFDACQGDSGGPLFANGHLYGLVSWGFGCARPNFPGVNTRVPFFTNWIVQTANNI